MKIAGLVKTSLIDFPGKVSAVVFTQGCNFRCGFCHNPELIPATGQPVMSEKEFFQFLNKRVAQLDGVVITGGEPTEQPDIIDFVRKIKSLNFAVKLDTNGANDRILAQMLAEKLLDYVAMDIKGPLDHYPKISKYTNTKSVQDSIKMLLTEPVFVEFRTTVNRTDHRANDIKGISTLIKGADLYTIQGFRPGHTLDKCYERVVPFSQKQLAEMADLARKELKNVRVIDNLS